MRKYLSSAKMTERGHGSRTTHWRRSRDPNDHFPAPYKLGPNRTGWQLGEVEAYEATLSRLGPLKVPAETEDEDDDSKDDEAEEEEAEPP